MKNNFVLESAAELVEKAGLNPKGFTVVGSFESINEILRALLVNDEKREYEFSFISHFVEPELDDEGWDVPYILDVCNGEIDIEKAIGENGRYKMGASEIELIESQYADAFLKDNPHEKEYVKTFVVCDEKDSTPGTILEKDPDGCGFTFADALDDGSLFYLRYFGQEEAVDKMMEQIQRIRSDLK